MIEKTLEELLLEQKHTNNLLRSILAALRADRQFMDIPPIDTQQLPYRPAIEKAHATKGDAGV